MHFHWMQVLHPNFILTDKKHHCFTGIRNYKTLIALCRSCLRICWPRRWNLHTQALPLLSPTVSVAPSFPLNPHRDVNPPAFEPLLLLQMQQPVTHRDVGFRPQISRIVVTIFRWSYWNHAWYSDEIHLWTGLVSVPAHVQSGFRPEFSIVLRRALKQLGKPRERSLHLLIKESSTPRSSSSRSRKMVVKI